MRELKAILFLYNIIAVFKLFTLSILTFIVLILEYHQFDSILFAILIILGIIDITILIYFYILIKQGKLEKKQIKENTTKTTIFWFSMFIICVLFLLINNNNNNSIYFINIYVCFSYLYLGFENKFIIHNNKGILKNGMFRKFILFNDIQDVQYLNNRIIIKTKNRAIKYNKFEDESLKLILDKQKNKYDKMNNTSHNTINIK